MQTNNFHHQTRKELQVSRPIYEDVVVDNKHPLPTHTHAMKRLALPSMSAATFTLFSEYIQEELGIKLNQNKQAMLQGRLMKRLRALGIGLYEEYYEYLFSAEGHKSELPYFVHQVTTNKTDFFREPAHFRYMAKTALSVLLNENRYSRHDPLRIWSTACSTGEEPYTLSMVMADYVEQNQPVNFIIMATDISPTVLQTAAHGIYESYKVDPVPHYFQKKYLLRSKDREKKVVRVVPELRSKVHFQWVNLKKRSTFNLDRRMDIIFCRNVLIYFSRKTQELVIRNLCTQLRSGGYLFTGHSETLSGFSLPLKQVATTIYRKK